MCCITKGCVRECVRGVLYHKRMYLRACERCAVSQKDVFESV